MATTSFIKTIIFLVFALIMFGVLIENAAWQTEGNTVVNESITFTANNTYYQPARTPIDSITYVRNGTAGLCTYETGQYTYDALQGIKVYTNGTGGTAACPNITAGDVLVITYEIVKPEGFGAIIVGLLVGIMAIVVVLMFLGKV